VERRVHFVAAVEPGQIAAHVASADLSVIPTQNACLSYYLSLPNKLLESTLAGLPVAVSNLPELVKFVELSQSGVVMDQAKPQDIARAMREVYARREVLRPNADRLARVEAVYGWATQKRALLDLYGTLLNRSGAVARAGLADPN
jgi:glycosyltransferase involved in cell wall biosynthesis